MRKLDGTLVAALFLEVAGESLDAVYVALFLHDFVEYLCVLHRADGERRREVVAVQFFGELGGFGESQFKAFTTTFSAFGFLFQAACHIVKFFRVVFALDERDWIFCLKFSDKSFNLVYAVLVFFGGGDVRVVIEERNFEILREVFDGVAAAWRATGVQQKRRDFARLFETADDAI